MRSLPKKWKAKVVVVQEVKDLSKLLLEELIRSLMTYEINMNKYQEVKRKKNDISFKTSTIDDEEDESENEEFDLISKKLMEYIPFE